MPGVPNTTNFSLADVVAAVLPSSNDLQECFNDAVDDAFDSTYYLVIKVIYFNSEIMVMI